MNQQSVATKTAERRDPEPSTSYTTYPTTASTVSTTTTTPTTSTHNVHFPNPKPGSSSTKQEFPVAGKVNAVPEPGTSLAAGPKTPAATSNTSIVKESTTAAPAQPPAQHPSNPSLPQQNTNVDTDLFTGCELAMFNTPMESTTFKAQVRSDTSTPPRNPPPHPPPPLPSPSSSTSVPNQVNIKNQEKEPAGNSFVGFTADMLNVSPNSRMFSACFKDKEERKRRQREKQQEFKLRMKKKNSAADSSVLSSDVIDDIPWGEELVAEGEWAFVEL